MPNPVKLLARVSSVESCGQGVYSVRLAPESPVPRFKAGQFLHMTVDDYDRAGGFWPESRVFSIASAPGAAELRIVYSVKGRYTRLMEQRLAPGLEVWLKLPYGEFIVEAAAARDQDIVLVAGGTGLSPFMPYLEEVALSGAKGRGIFLYYGARRNAMLLARETIGRCVAAGSVTATIAIEEEEPGSDIPPGVKAEGGRLDIGRIRGACGRLRDPVFFISGPPPMIKAFRENLIGLGIGPGNIKTDDWE